LGRVKGMKTNYAIILLILTLAAVLTVSSVPCWAQRTGEEKKEEKKEDSWTEEKPRGPRRGPRFELTDEEIERIMKSIKESKPEKAKELVESAKTLTVEKDISVVIKRIIKLYENLL